MRSSCLASCDRTKVLDPADAALDDMRILPLPASNACVVDERLDPGRPAAVQPADGLLSITLYLAIAGDEAPASLLADASPHSRGRVVERLPASPSFAGIDVSKNHLNVHLRPSAQVFAVARDGQALAQLVDDLRPNSSPDRPRGHRRVRYHRGCHSGERWPSARGRYSTSDPRFCPPPDGSPKPTRSMLR
jgi:hypothetical protein